MSYRLRTVKRSFGIAREEGDGAARDAGANDPNFRAIVTVVHGRCPLRLWPVVRLSRAAWEGSVIVDVACGGLPAGGSQATLWLRIARRSGTGPNGDVLEVQSRRRRR